MSVLLPLLTAAALAGAPARFALVAGANDGGPERTVLRYAVSDAQAMGEVLTGLGGVPQENLVLLQDPSRDELRASLRSLGGRAREAGEGSSVLVYYSGHSDRSGLHLSRETYAWDTLRTDLEDLGASVQIAIVDGCASGALVRAKGGSPAPAFLVSEEVEVQGRAWLTSSSSDEVSQEADHIGASYFTHALISGLRGGADYDGDQRVTLREAYQFAAEETLARTERTRLGAQHPTYDLRLAGMGDFVLTDLSSPSSRLRLSRSLRGRLYLRDGEGRLVAELLKRSGREVDLGLPAGRYTVVLEDEGRLHEGTVRLSGERELSPEDLVSVRGEVTLARGRLYATVPLAIELLPYPTSEGLNARDQLHYAALGAIAVYGARLRGLSVGSVATTYRDGVDGAQVAAAYTHSGGPTRGAQLSLGVNASAGALGGLQLGAVDLSGPVRGAQLGAFVTFTPDLRGVQLGTLNLARRSRGVQVGVVNWSVEHSGLSLGVVHLSSTSRGVPLALLPLVGDGMHHAEVWTSTTLPLNLGFKRGSRTVYTQYALGWDPRRGVGSVGLGFGARARTAALHLDVDALATVGGAPQAAVLLPSVRLSAACPLREERLAPFLAVSLGLELPLEPGAEPLSALGGVALSDELSLVPEVAVGFRI